MKHTLDNDKLNAELDKRGWYKNVYKGWETVQPKSEEQANKDFAEAFLASVVCPHEDHEDDPAV